ncbi:DUF58 domain-containing protein [Halomicrobium sp. HM KBTZ05]|uniref:DUF58 domain-containing protein n=1 Tax=Halomicrobium sp. HM KBTZ05 TaxID=3242663 RepID=UPI0035585C15
MTSDQVKNRDVGLAVALVAGSAGLLAGESALLLAAVVGLVYTAYEATTGPPAPALEIERSVSRATPTPGQSVDVTVTVTNHDERAAPDVRIVDGVPERLAVTDGSPRVGTAVEPGESVSFTYSVRARRGTHQFQPTTVECRSLAGDAADRQTVPIETEIDCTVDVRDIVTGTQTLPYPGRIETDSPGRGVSFHSVRSYHSTDSLSRIDWKRFARTRELATVEYSAQRAAAYVVVADTRVDFAASEHSPTATQYVSYAAERIGTALLEDSHQVGGALFDRGTVLSPGSTRTQLLELRTLILEGRHPDHTETDGSVLEGFDGRRFFDGALDSETPAVVDGGFERGGRTRPGSIGRDRDVRDLDRRLPDRAQILFCTPLLDQRASRAARRLAAYGRDVTVVSPDVTGGDSPGTLVERITRADRVQSLRRSVGVVDWDPDQSLSVALRRAQERWSR